jgi:hypothetical protein
VPTEQKSSVYAQEGTALHELLGYCLEHDAEPKAMLPYTFTTPKDGGWSFTVTEDLWEEKGEPALRAFDTFVADEEERLGLIIMLIIIQ